MKLAVILNIYHKPHAITDSRTQSYRTQAHFVTGNLAPIMHVSWCRHTNKQTHTHLLFQWGVYVCFWHALWPLTWWTISRAAGEVWLPVIKKKKKWPQRFYRCIFTHTHTQAKICLHRYLCILIFIGRNSHNTSVTKCNWIQAMGWQYKGKITYFKTKNTIYAPKRHPSLFGTYLKNNVQQLKT